MPSVTMPPATTKSNVPDPVGGGYGGGGDEPGGDDQRGHDAPHGARSSGTPTMAAHPHSPRVWLQPGTVEGSTLQKFGSIYTRIGNPTFNALEERLASLEGGIVIESGTFDWDNGRFPTFTEPVDAYGGLRWWENFGEYAFLTKLRSEQLRDIRAGLTPLVAFLLLQGVETLPQRMDAHMANTHAAAAWLRSDPRVAWVNWAGLDDHPHHDRAARYAPAGPGALFSFGVLGGRDAGRTFIESLELCSHLANIGDVRTLLIHPAGTTHQQLSDDQLAVAGVSADLIRISVGLEDPDDICWDLDRALDAAVASRSDG